MEKLFYKNLGDEGRATYIQAVLTAQNNLINFYLAACERAIKSLTLVNSGGIISILSYLHADRPLNYWLIFSLIGFVCGLFSALLLLVLDFRGSLSRIKEFGEEIEQFQNNAISTDQIRAFSADTNTSNSSMYVGYLSLIFGIIGIIMGFIGYFKNIVII